jgi:hypothetical protein
MFEDSAKVLLEYQASATKYLERKVRVSFLSEIIRHTKLTGIYGNIGSVMSVIDPNLFNRINL